MSDPAYLLEDLFSFLCALHADDIGVRGARWLPTRALHRINASLRLRDSLHGPLRAQRGGRYGSTERETHRIRFLHFLAESAGLVACAGRYLKPTSRIAGWLRASPFEQATQLMSAAFPAQPNRDHDDRWRAFRLPGGQCLASPSAELRPVLNLLRDAPPGEHIRLTTIRKLAPLPAYDGDDAEDRPERILHQVLLILNWLGVVAWCGPHRIEVTDWGAALLGRPHAPAPCPGLLSYSPAALACNDRTTLPIPNDRPTLYELAGYADPVAAAPRRLYRLSRDRVQRAFQRGVSLDHLLRFLRLATGSPLPDPVGERLRRWRDEIDSVSISRVTLLEARDPALLNDLAGSRRDRETFARTLSPRAVVVREARLRPLLRSLERRGLCPRLDAPSPSRARPRALQAFSPTTLAHLAVSLRLGYELSDLLPPEYRAPYSILQDIEDALDESGRADVKQAAAEAAARLRCELMPVASQPREDDLPVSDERLAAVQDRLAHAIAGDDPLRIVYTDARRETTARIVEPHRIEWRGATPYLIAFCRLDRDERTFRLDRIREMQNVE